MQGIVDSCFVRSEPVHCLIVEHVKDKVYYDNPSYKRH